MTDTNKMNALYDKQAIYELMSRYADRIDANDPHGAAACFAEDGEGDYWGVYKGRAAIAERLTGILDQFEATSHHLSNVQITLKGDTATAQSYVYAFHRVLPDQKLMHYWGRWVDTLVRVNGEWLFQNRRVVGVGSDGTGAIGGEDIGHPGHPGRLQRSA